MKIFTQSYTVKNSDTANKLLSGSLPVYATPAMIALMENTSTKAINDLDGDFTTVGIEIDTKHLKASQVGEILNCKAEIIEKKGKIYEFYIEVTNSNNEMVGTATHKRATVNKIDFMKRLKQ
ncbi:MAG: thioesterase family protein [Paludibacteraceae bacterium]